jgi:hypothetical protein
LFNERGELVKSVKTFGVPARGENTLDTAVYEGVEGCALIFDDIKGTMKCEI